MKFLSFKILGITLAVILSGALGGCLRDDYSDCPTRVFLRFEYSLNVSRADLFDAELNDLDLYIYNSEGTLVDKHHVARTDLEPGNVFVFTQPKGDYTVVVWGNKNPTDFFLTNTDNMEAMRLELRSSVSGFVDPAPGTLFHGITKLSLRNEEEMKQTVSLTKNTSNIHIVINQTGGSNVALGDYTVEITGSNGKYKYDNTLVADKLLQYSQSYTVTAAKTIQADCNVMRLSVGDDMRLVIKSRDGTVRYNESLTDKIMIDPAISRNEDFDRWDDHTLTFGVTLGAGDTFVSIKLVSINDWDVIGGGGAIGG